MSDALAGVARQLVKYWQLAELLMQAWAKYGFFPNMRSTTVRPCAVLMRRARQQASE